MSENPRSVTISILLIRLLSFVALMMCLWLSWQRYTGKITSLAGCGGEEGCSQVLGSDWSLWFFGIPVTTLAAGLWAAVLVFTFFPKRDFWRAVLGMSLIFAAVWFGALLVFEVQAFCVWCATLHTIGLVVGLMLIKSAWSFLPKAIPLAFLGLGLLLSGQIWGEKEDSHERENLSAYSDGNNQADGARQFSFEGGAITFRLDQVPHIGNPKAANVLVKFFDYTCKSCREVHGDIEVLMKKYPGDYLVLLVPTPLNSACNPYKSHRITNHENACEYSQLAWTVWKTQPEKFAEFHHAIMSLPIKAPFAEGEAIAKKFISAEEVATVSSDQEIAKWRKTYLEYYKALSSSNARMPKVILREQVIHGVVRSTAQFIGIVEGVFAQ